MDMKLQYPVVRRDDSVVDDYHGVLVPDPYRWLEDRGTEEVKDFVEKQVELTDSVLEKCETRENLREKLTNLFDHPRYGVPFRRGDSYYFYYHNTGLQAHDVLYIQDSLNGEGKVLLDPNELSEDGTVALRTLSVSEDAKYVAYGLSLSGSDWVTIKIMQINERRTELDDTLSWVKFSGISWTKDSKGFFYTRYPSPKEGAKLDAGTETNVNLNQEVYYHFLGNNQSEDILCWNDPENSNHLSQAFVTNDGKYVLLYIYDGCSPVNKLYYYEYTTSVLSNGLQLQGMIPFVKLVDNFDAEYTVVANDDSSFTFRTNKDAPKYKLVRVDLNEPNIWDDILAEDDKDVLLSAYPVNNDQMIVCYLSDVKHVVQLRDLKTGSFLRCFPFDIGTASDISCRREDSIAFIGFTNFLTPNIIYQCDLETGDMRIFREVVVSGFDRGEFSVDQVFVGSKDGKVGIPVFIVARNGISLDGSHPCLLYGYGGFGCSLTSHFGVSRVVLMKHLGVVFCLANIRGGGEYGEEWHKDGSLGKKMNCFDDFVSVGEYLVGRGYTQPKKLCIEGGSNGGLLVGACINQRPDLFGCALAHVGVMDMLRFHNFTIGHAWISEFGCSSKEKEFHWLIKYSPLHNVRRPWDVEGGPIIKASEYPATMLLTADHDDRVVPLHSLKMLATMQYVLCSSLEKKMQTNPIVGRIERKAGHGAGRPTQKIIDEAADRYGFMAKMLGATWIHDH